MVDGHAGLLAEQQLQRPLGQLMLLAKCRQIKVAVDAALQRRHQQVQLFPVRQHVHAIHRIAIAFEHDRQL
ncbi:hypothetical protein D3C85_1862060 [compost metagenome]